MVKDHSLTQKPKIPEVMLLLVLQTLALHVVPVLGESVVVVEIQRTMTKGMAMPTVVTAADLVVATYVD